MLRMWLDYILIPTFIQYSFFIYKTKVCDSIQVSFASSFFIKLYSSSNLRLSICIKSIEVLFEIKKPFFHKFTHSIQTLRVPFVRRLLVIIESFFDIFGGFFPLLVNLPKGVESRIIRILFIGLAQVYGDCFLGFFRPSEAKKEFMCELQLTSTLYDLWLGRWRRGRRFLVNYSLNLSRLRPHFDQFISTFKMKYSKNLNSEGLY